MADADEVRAAKALCERLVERALAMDGTCTGEHGVGEGKIKYLAQELGTPALQAMAAIKRALDPENILNPGKIVPFE
jgi:D-lactate dehydrogenase (cytochrome)